MEDSFSKFFYEKLQEYNINANRVTLEVLENITVGAHQYKILDNLNILKGFGCKIAVDDFIKLDAVFIKNIDINKNDQTVVSAIVSMSKALGIKTIAEYVDVLDILKLKGIDMIQGYYVGKPEPYLI